MAPSRALPWRYALTNKPNTVSSMHQPSSIDHQLSQDGTSNFKNYVPDSGTSDQHVGCLQAHSGRTAAGSSQGWLIQAQ